VAAAAYGPTLPDTRAFERPAETGTPADGLK
jgi:hypothetical protein